jgi:hypothetical protein
VLRPQRLAAPATVYVQQFSAHPLEQDAAELYGPPDGYVDASGTFHEDRQSDSDTPVYRVELTPEDGLYPLPYMARQADGSAWEDDCAYPGAPASHSRQAYYPDGARIFEEIDRFGMDEHGMGNLISRQADVDFYRVLPSGGYTKGFAAADRTDMGEGDIPAEELGQDFFVYRPVHLAVSPSRGRLATIVNDVQKILDSGDYLGAIWTQGSPRVEETLYWMNLLLDTTLPVCGNAAQRTHGEISNDGPKNLVDSVDYISSRVWQDSDGRNRAGAVVIQEQQIFASREVQKGDARPGGYVVTGGHGGLLGAVRHGQPPILTYLPGAKHTYLSDVNRSKLPDNVTGYLLKDGAMMPQEVPIKNDAGELVDTSIPMVTIIKEGNYSPETDDSGPEREVDILAQTADNLAHMRPCRVSWIEGQSPYGSMTEFGAQPADGKSGSLRHAGGSVSDAAITKASRAGRCVPRRRQSDIDQGKAAADRLPDEVSVPCPRRRTRMPRPMQRRRRSWTAGAVSGGVRYPLKTRIVCTTLRPDSLTHGPHPALHGLRAFFFRRLFLGHYRHGVRDDLPCRSWR